MNEKGRLWGTAPRNDCFERPHFAVAQTWEKGNVIDESVTIPIFRFRITLLLLILSHTLISTILGVIPV